MTPRDWTPAEDAALLEAREAKEEWQSIAVRLHRSSDSCRSRHKRLRRGFRYAEWTVEQRAIFAEVMEIARASGVGWDTVAREMDARTGRAFSVRALKSAATRQGIRPLPGVTHRVDFSRPKSNGAAARRTCLRCRQTFNSEHTGNRVCTPCKGSDDWKRGAMDAESHALRLTATA